MPSGFWTILIMFFISFSGKIKTQNIKLIKLWIGFLLLSFNPQNHLEIKTGEPGNWTPAQTKFYQRNLISQHIIIRVINNCFYSSSQKISFSHFHFFLHFLWSVVAGVSWSQLESAGVSWSQLECPWLLIVQLEWGVMMRLIWWDLEENVKREGRGRLIQSSDTQTLANYQHNLPSNHWHGLCFSFKNVIIKINSKP